MRFLFYAFMSRCYVFGVCACVRLVYVCSAINVIRIYNLEMIAHFISPEICVYDQTIFFSAFLLFCMCVFQPVLCLSRRSFYEKSKYSSFHLLSGVLRYTIYDYATDTVFFWLSPYHLREHSESCMLLAPSRLCVFPILFN